MTFLDDKSNTNMTPEEYNAGVTQLESLKNQAVDEIKARIMADMSTLAGFGIHAEIDFGEKPNTVRMESSTPKEVNTIVGDLSKLPKPVSGALCPKCGKLFDNAQQMGAHRRVTKACKVKKGE